MRIVDIREISVPLEGNISNALVNFSEHTVSLLALVSDVVRQGRPVCGLAFNSIGRFAQSGLLRERFIPRVLRAEPGDLLAPDGRSFCAESIYRIAMRNEKPGGHGDRAAAVAALELAVWDLNAKLADEPAHAHIARAVGRPVRSAPVPVYAAGGYYYPGDSSARLRAELMGYRDLGFVDFKIKIGGDALATDLARVQQAIDLAGGGQHVAVDANGRFDQASAERYAQALEPLKLRWFEEAGDPLDYALNRWVIERYQHPVATGENLFSAADTLNLLRFGGMRTPQDIFQMDAGLSYGLSEYLRIIELLQAHGFARTQVLPHGGHLINLHIVAGLGLGGCEVYPGVFQPFGGYPSACMVAEGMAFPTDAPGFGLEQKAELRPALQRLLNA